MCWPSETLETTCDLYLQLYMEAKEIRHDAETHICSLCNTPLFRSGSFPGDRGHGHTSHVLERSMIFFGPLDGRNPVAVIHLADI
jgi:hypothetical protein